MIQPLFLLEQQVPFGDSIVSPSEQDSLECLAVESKTGARCSFISAADLINGEKEQEVTHILSWSAQASWVLTLACSLHWNVSSGEGKKESLHSV